jgi:hypothetical protein
MYAHQLVEEYNAHVKLEHWKEKLREKDENNKNISLLVAAAHQSAIAYCISTFSFDYWLISLGLSCLATQK